MTIKMQKVGSTLTLTFAAVFLLVGSTPGTCAKKQLMDPMPIEEVNRIPAEPNSKPFPASQGIILGRYQPGTKLVIRTDRKTGEVLVKAKSKSVKGLERESHQKPRLIKVNPKKEQVGSAEWSTKEMRPKFLPFEHTPTKRSKMPGGELTVDTQINSTERAVFDGESRYFYRSLAFPYSAIGRLSNGCSGTMVGPRHLLTAAHCVAPDGANVIPVSFTPATSDGDAPFGSASSTATYVYAGSVFSDGVTSEEAARDLAVVVLDSRIGDTTGWLGAREYSEAWNGIEYWTHVGYPAEYGGQLQPYLQTGAISSAISHDLGGGITGMDINFFMDQTPGQSGGPTFGFFGDQAIIVGVHSSGLIGSFTSSGTTPGFENSDGGGPAMVALIERALAEYP